MTLPSSIADLAEEYLADHYPNGWERAVDRWIHIVALVLAAIGAAWLIARAAGVGQPGLVIAAGLYGAALICMLAFSAIYNLSHVTAARPALRRLDEAGIFLMIAGSYTPFTTQRLDGAWAIGMTGLVWTIAALGIIGKLAFPKISERGVDGALCGVWLGGAARSRALASQPARRRLRPADRGGAGLHRRLPAVSQSAPSLPPRGLARLRLRGRGPAFRGGRGGRRVGPSHRRRMRLAFAGGCDASWSRAGPRSSLGTARVIHHAALQDFPGRRIVLRKGEMIIADSRG
jgi:hypothetical protein